MGTSHAGVAARPDEWPTGPRAEKDLDWGNDLVVKPDMTLTRDGSEGISVPDRSGQGWPRLLALVFGALALVASLALPFAPVSQNEPEVSWPVDPSAPTSTMLMLSAYRPLTLDATFSCRLAQQEAAPASVVLATTRPDSNPGVASGLLVTSLDGLLTVTSRGEEIVREPVGTAPCEYTVSGRGDTIVVSRDGRELGQGAMPDVDALTTSAAALPDATFDDISVRLTVDDRFSTSPAPLKVVILVLLAISVGLSVAYLALADRQASTTRPHKNATSIRRRDRVLRAAVDAAVVTSLIAWLFLAPLTPDDGYYSAMATNASFEGYVGNYYQVFNQGFTPFTWIYQALAWWQALFGLSPVVLRVPALVCGLLTWACARRIVLLRGLIRATPRAPQPRRDILCIGALGVCFLAWWMPFNLGVRPEPAIALATVACLLCVLLAAERRSLVLAGAAVGIASLGATTSPSGLVALAPLIVGAPTLWKTIRQDGDRLATAARLVCALATGGLGAVAAFGDGSLGDFFRAQELLYGVQDFESWFTEYKRWASVLAPGAWYAIRAALFVTVLALIGFAALWAATQARGRSLPRPLVLAGATVVLGFALLAPSPSKPWMHFGAVAGIGAVFLAMMLVDGPRALRNLTQSRRLPATAVLAAAATVVLTLALAGHGSNEWWLSFWSPEMPNAGISPQVGFLRFDQPLWWAVGGIAAAAVIRVAASRTHSGWRPYATILALCSIVIVFLAGNVAYLLGTFGIEAARTEDSWSIPGDNLRDPFAHQCSAGSQVEVADPAGTPLAEDPSAPPPEPSTGFAPLAWPASTPAPVPTLSPPATTGWGSLVDDPEEPDVPPDAYTGAMTTAWLAIPPVGPDQAITSFVAGRTGDGGSLTVEYGRRSPSGVTVLDTRRLGDSEETNGSTSSAWRSVDLVSRDSVPPAESEVLRLVARDDRTDIGGWVAFTAPQLSTYEPLEEVLAGGAPTSVSWPIALLFPCVRQPRIQDGITEPTTWAVGATLEPYDLLRDGTWQPARGGLFGQAGRQALITQLAARFRTSPDIRPVQVYRLQEPYPARTYSLTPGRRTVPGWEA